MKIEKEKIEFQPFQLNPTIKGGTLTVLSNRKNYYLSQLQYSYVEILGKTESLEQMIHFFLGQGWLVSFRELFNLVQFLATERIIKNSSFQNYFSQMPSSLQHFGFKKMEPKTSASSNLNHKELPFFRSLDTQLANYLLQKTESFHVSEQTILTKTGARDRDLYILTKGQAAVYRVLGDKQRQMISILGPGSIFGEIGFLLGQARTADVITLQPSEVLKIHHLPEFDLFIKTDKARELQHRFWILQALHSSPFFKDLPNDSLDDLIFNGRLCQLPENQILFREGQSGNACYIIVQGNVIISQNGRNINIQGQGTCFGEISLLASGGIRTATVMAQQPTILLEINQRDFYRVLSRNLILAKEIEALAAQRLSNDIQRKNKAS